MLCLPQDCIVLKAQQRAQHRCQPCGCVPMLSPIDDEYNAGLLGGVDLQAITKQNGRTEVRPFVFLQIERLHAIVLLLRLVDALLLGSVLQTVALLEGHEILLILLRLISWGAGLILRPREYWSDPAFSRPPQRLAPLKDSARAPAAKIDISLVMFISIPVEHWNPDRGQRSRTAADPEALPGGARVRTLPRALHGPGHFVTPRDQCLIVELARGDV